MQHTRVQLSHLPAEFFIVPAAKCDSYTRILQKNPPFASNGMYYYAKRQRLYERLLPTNCKTIENHAVEVHTDRCVYQTMAQLINLMRSEHALLSCNLEREYCPHVKKL